VKLDPSGIPTDAADEDEAEKPAEPPKKEHFVFRLPDDARIRGFNSIDDVRRRGR
jgi:hypothetical protein